MPGNTCCICKTTGIKENLKMFKVPKNSAKRELWNTACGKNLKDTNRLCERHFRPDNFFKPKIESNVPGFLQRRRLKADAVPTQLLPGQDNNSAAMEATDPLLIKYKCEAEYITNAPDETVCMEFSPVVPEVKVSSADDVAYDDFTSTSIEDTLIISKKLLHKNYHTEAKKYTCGFVELVTTEKNYVLTCSVCSMEFTVSNWQKFVEHVEIEHLEGVEKYTSASSADQRWQNESFDESNMGTNEQTLETEIPLLETNYINAEENEVQTSPDDCNEIHFGKTKDEIIMDFLEATRTRPVLWEKRYKAPEIFDKATTELAALMSKNWQLSMTPTDVQMSLQRCKDYHRRFLLYRKRGLQMRYQKYAEKIDELVLYPKFDCSYCGNIFLNEMHLKTHYFTHHNVGKLPYKCQYCDEHFGARHKVERHENQKHSKEIQFFCPICKRGFVYEYMLRRHKVVHQDERRTCDICGKKFRNPSDVRVHKVMHEQPKFKCQVCEKLYFTQGKLKFHMKLHRNEREFVCEQCGKYFLRQRTLNEHMRTAHFGFKYNCSLCIRNFKTKTSLIQHKRTSHLVREGTNEELERASFKPYSKHMFIIDKTTNTKRLVCDICGNSYKYYSGLRLHKMNAHGWMPSVKQPAIDMNINNNMDEEEEEEILRLERAEEESDSLMIEEYIECDENGENNKESLEMEVLEECSIEAENVPHVVEIILEETESD